MSWWHLGAGRTVCQRHAPAALPQGNSPGTNCTGDRFRFRAGLDGWGENILASTGFLQRVVTGYIDYAIPALNADKGLPLCGALINMKFTNAHIYWDFHAVQDTNTKQPSSVWRRYCGVGWCYVTCRAAFSVDIEGWPAIALRPDKYWYCALIFYTVNKHPFHYSFPLPYWLWPLYQIQRNTHLQNEQKLLHTVWQRTGIE
jgi:hypothetical protein